MSSILTFKSLKMNKGIIDNFKNKYALSLSSNLTFIPNSNKNYSIMFKTKKSSINKSKSLKKNHIDLSDNMENKINQISDNNLKVNKFNISNDESSIIKNQEDIKINVDKSLRLVDTNVKTTELIINKKIIKDNISYSNEIKSDENKSKLNNNNVKKKEEYNTCFLCERTYLKILLYSSKCKTHFFCRDCLNLYFKGLINKKIFNVECPVFTCNHEFNLDVLKNIIDLKSYKEISNITPNNKNKKEKITNEAKKKKHIEFSTKSIFTINSSDEFLEVLKNKKYFCPKCHMNVAFYKTNSHFYKCLKCNYKICKYCFKEYTSTHLISNEIDYCKVYGRFFNQPKNNNFKLFFKHILFVFAMFIICLFSSFFLPLSYFKNKFDIYNDKKNNKNICFKLFSSYLLSIILMIILLPFIFILFPYFPYFVAVFDIN